MTRILPGFMPAFALGLTLALPAGAQTAPAADAATAPAAAEAAAGTAAPAASADAVAAGDISGSYSFDPEHSQIVFSYDHMGFSISRGFVNGVTGTVVLDQADPSKSTVEAQFPLSAIRTVAPSLDSHLFDDDFFKGAAPETLVTFKSTSVATKGDDGDEAEVTGDLTLNGVTKPVVLDVELNKAAPNPMTNKPAVGFEIETEIKRSDFGLGAFVPAVSDEVKIEIAVEAAKG